MVKAFLTLITLLIIIMLTVRLIESTFAFFPIAGETMTPNDFGIPHRPFSIATADGEQLRAWAMVHAAPHAQIVYFHGNGGNLSIWAPVLAGIARRGYSV